MPVTLNIKQGIDLPVYQWLRFMPVTTAAGATQCNDERGTDRYVYMLLGATSFWRYDTWTDNYQQLASPVTAITFAAGTAMVYDPSQGSGRVWLFAPSSSSPYAIFQYYDVATNVWTARNAPTGLGAQWGTDAHLAHTCTSYAAGGNDDYIYLIGNNVTTWYRYSISGNTWTTMATALTGTAGAGCAIIWPYNWSSAGKLWVLRGGATANVYIYDIAGGTFSTPTYNPNTETFTTGTCVAQQPGSNRIYIQKDATHRTFYYDLAANTMAPAGMWPYTSGTAHVGDGFNYTKTPDGAEFLYYRRQTGTEFWRTLLGWF